MRAVFAEVLNGRQRTRIRLVGDFRTSFCGTLKSQRTTRLPLTQTSRTLFLLYFMRNFSRVQAFCGFDSYRVYYTA